MTDTPPQVDERSAEQRVTTSPARDGESTPRPDLRPVNMPIPITVETDSEGEPVFVMWRGRRIAVMEVADRWRIDDEWWRTPISRLYRVVTLIDDRLFTLFEDLLTGRWYAQGYRYGRGAEHLAAGSSTDPHAIDPAPRHARQRSTRQPNRTT